MSSAAGTRLGHFGTIALVLASLIIAAELTGAATLRQPRQSCPEGRWFQEYARGSRVPIRVGGEAEWTEALGRIRQYAARWIPLEREKVGRTSNFFAPCVPDASEPRRLIVGTYVLDFVMTNAAIAWQPGGRELVEWACDVLRAGPLTDSDIERTWFRASIALLERVHGPATRSAVPGIRGMQQAVETPYERTPLANTHIGHAERRLPGLGVWPLARVIAEELDSWPEYRDEKPFQVSERRASQLADLFKTAVSHAEVRDEGLVRWGYFELRHRRPDAALALFDRAAPDADDLMLLYWLHLFKGRALERLGRHEEAVTLYERALEDVPDAQSAAFALASALVALRRPDGSAAIVTRALSMRPAPYDPWVMYPMPSSRHWPELIGSLRRAIRP